MVARSSALNLAAALVGGLLAACGATESGSDAKASDADVRECVAKATELRDSKRDEPPLKILGPTDMSAHRGKTLWVINAARVPFLQSILDRAESASKAAGMNVKVV